MNDSGSTRPERGPGTAAGDTEVFVPPARQGEQANAGQSDAGMDAVGSDVPGEPPAPLEGYERV